MEVRKNYRNLWHTDLLRTTQADTPFCCFAAFCGPCASYMLRKCALYGDISKFASALQILWPQPALSCKTSLIYKQRNVTIALLVSCFACNNSPVSQILNCLSDVVYCKVCACMQTQHKVEMDKRDGHFGPQLVMAVPPQQQMSSIDQQIPPSVGYAPQPGYVQGSQGYGYPPAQGYPVAGYPPSGYPPGYSH